MKKIKKILRFYLLSTTYKTKSLAGKIGFSAYPYMYEPSQMFFIGQTAIDSATLEGGAMLEVGCAYGCTTIFLNKLLNENGFPSSRYHAIDTFCGFVESDVDVEIQRGKPARLKNAFSCNKLEWFRKNLETCQVKGVNIHEADVNKFDFNKIGPISFCLLDVDLYQPISAVLPIIYEKLLPGGTIIVDDVRDERVFDGAYQAYMEFVDKNKIEPVIKYGKLGILKK